MKIKRAFLIGVIVCLSAAALLGIIALLAGEANELTLRSIFTMLTVGLFSAVALAAADAQEKKLWFRMMFVAFGCQAVGAVLYLASIWDLMDWLGSRGELLVRTMGLITTWSVALPLGAQLAGLRLAGTPALLRPASIAMAMLLAVMISAAFIGEIDSEVFYRFMGVVAILGALAAITGRIVQRVQGLDKIAGVESTRMALEIKCPRCLLTQTVGNGVSRCSRCRLKFTIEIEEPRCPHCNYLLFKLESPLCPECGRPLAPEDIATATP